MLNKQIFFTDIHRAELLEKEIRKINDNEVLVKMEYTVISGGTERACILGMNNTSQKFPTPQRPRGSVQVDSGDRIAHRLPALQSGLGRGYRHDLPQREQPHHG